MHHFKFTPDSPGKNGSQKHDDWTQNGIILNLYNKLETIHDSLEI